MNNYTDQIADVLSGNSDIRNVSDSVIQGMLDDHPYSPYSHLLHYLKAKATNRTGTEQLLQRLAVYSPDRAWLQTVLNTQFQQVDFTQESIEQSIPSEAKDPNLDRVLFEFDFATVRTKEDLAEFDVSDLDNDKEVVETFTIPAKQPLSNAREEEYTPKQGSYIEWLKTMKVQEEETVRTKSNKQTTEKTVEKTTRKDEDLFGGIITETLAQLLANQGQIEKAINMYDRLSLIFPEKSAFFAAKIEQLKSNIT